MQEGQNHKKGKGQADMLYRFCERKKLAFLTSMFEAKTLTVCLLYQNRWSIEVLFKQLKQNFELTYFLSDIENGIKIQIWGALILNLLFEVIHKQIKEAEDFATMVKIAASKHYSLHWEFLPTAENTLICKKIFSTVAFTRHRVLFSVLYLAKTSTPDFTLGFLTFFEKYLLFKKDYEPMVN